MKTKLIIAVLLISFFHSCKKESSLQFPIHENSFSWIMSNPPYYFVNRSQDTLIGDYLSSLMNSGSQTNVNGVEISREYYDHVLRIDSFISLKTRLSAGLFNSERTDQIQIQFTDSIRGKINMIGIAEPDNKIDDINTIYYDSLFINSIKYSKVYSASSVDSALTIFVNQNKVLAGFVIESDTFSLVN